MNEGLLWFDKDPGRKLADKVGEAATRYQEKNGVWPNICYCNWADLNGEEGTDIGGVMLLGASNVLRYHLWIGVENKAKLKSG